MYISEIKIKKFKRFADKKFSFEHGLNIIKGANEQGKSTLLKAIIAALYADPNSSKVKEAYKSWDQDTFPVIEMDFFIDNKLYVIQKDFNTKETILTSVLTKEEERNFVVIMQQVKEFTGIANEELLRSTACIHHDEMSQLESGRKSLHKALQDISLNEGDTDVLDILKNLDAKIEEMQVGLYHPAKYNGVIKKLQDEIDEKTTELSQLKSKESEVGGAGDKLQSLQQELKDVSEQISKYTKTVEDYEKKETVQKELDSVTEQVKNLSVDANKIEELAKKIDIIEAKIDDFGGNGMLEVMDTKQKDLLSLNQDIQTKKALAEKVSVKPIKKEEKRTRKIPIYIFILIGALTIGSVFYGLIFNLVAILFGLFFAFVEVILIVVSVFISSPIEESEEDDTQTLINEVTELEARLHADLSVCGVESLEEFFTKRTQLIALHADYIQMKSTIDALLRDHTVTELRETLHSAIQKKAELEASMPETEVVSKDQYVRDKRELELLHLDKKDIENEIIEEQTKIKVVDIKPEDITQKEERLQSLQKELTEQKQHLEVLQTVRTALGNAKDDISSYVSENIQKYVEKSLTNITNGKYSSLRMDKEFHIEVFSPEKKEWIDPNKHLSKGTIDQVYLSARLALADILTNGKPIPLFFDDPFLTFDEKRRNLLMEELKKISEYHQIFIFTCHDFFDEFGKLISVGEEEGMLQ